MLWKITRTILFALLIAITALVAANCTMLSLNYASLETDNKPAASPEIQAASIADWEAQKPALLQAFADTVYGPWPEGLAVSYGEARLVQSDFAGGRGVLEEVPITIGEGPGARTFRLAIAYPNEAREAPAPVILAQTFASTCAVFPGAGLTAIDGDLCEEVEIPGVFRFIFGKYIALAPIEQYFDRGYAYASFYASELVPDSNGAAQAVMAQLTTDGSPAPTGALSAWAYGFSAALTHLEADPRIDPTKTALFGHSRHAKSALLAAAWDDRVDAVFAHQAGFGGASLSRSRTGEGVKRITKNYGYWFDPAYASYARRLDEIPVDQHQLIALVAPRPVLLGNARRDVWSDPNSSFRAAAAADRVYELYGVEGFDQAELKDTVPEAELSFYMRVGGHGVQQEDIDAMLNFFDAHFHPDRAPTAVHADQSASR